MFSHSQSKRARHTPTDDRGLRVAVCVVEVAGVAAGLQKGLESQGHQVDLLLRWEHPFGYSYRRPSHPVTRALIRGARRRETDSILRRVRSEAAAGLLVMLCMTRYDAVVFLGTGSLLYAGVDRWLLRAARRRVITVFCGSDARPPYLNGRWMDPSDGPPNWAALAAATTRIRRAVRRAERTSDVIVSSNTTAQFLTRPFVDWNVLGMPSAAPAPRARLPRPSDRPPIVVHAPSAAHWKGTMAFRAALTQLRAADVAFELVEIIGRPHGDVLAALADADIALDELYSDALLAGFSLEAARAGAAVAVFGYAEDQFDRAASETGAPTDHYRSPELLATRLRELLLDRTARDRLGQELHDFATKAWSEAAVAARYETLLTGTPPAGWTLSGDDVYAFGWGLNRALLRDRLQNFIAAQGIEALQLSKDRADQLLRALSVQA